MSTTEALEILKKYQAWRTGRDDRTLDEIGLTPRIISFALEHAIEVLEGSRKP